MLQVIDNLNKGLYRTSGDLRYIERMAAACEDEDAAAFQGPMTSAWERFVNSQQFLLELRGLTPGFPISAEAIAEALRKVRRDPDSNRSWNLAWLALRKMKRE